MADSAGKSRRTVHVRILGRVQGVGYRAWVADAADELGLDGWVRNRTDGSVEAVFGGDDEAVAQMLDRCRSGPPAARVTRIDVVTEGLAVDAGFNLARTA